MKLITRLQERSKDYLIKFFNEHQNEYKMTDDAVDSIWLNADGYGWENWVCEGFIKGDREYEMIVHTTNYTDDWTEKVECEAIVMSVYKKIGYKQEQQLIFEIYGLNEDGEYVNLWNWLDELQ